MTLEVIFYRVLNRCVITNEDRAVTARATIMLLLMDDLANEEGACSGVAQASINVISSITTLRTTNCNEIGSSNTCRITCVNDLATYEVSTSARLTRLIRRIINAVSSDQSRLTESRRLITTSNETSRSIVCNARTRRIINVRRSDVLDSALPCERITDLLPMRMYRTELNAYAINVRGITVL